MDILWYHPETEQQYWLDGLRQRLPDAGLRVWQPGDAAPADYALVRTAPVEVLRGRDRLKAVFAIGAGVDDILATLKQQPDMLAPDVALYRLEDTGMARQMQEYAVYHVLGWFRRFDQYQQQQRTPQWHRLSDRRRETFTVGILGAGVLGRSVAESLRPWGFPLRCWSRTPKQLAGVTSFHGRDLPDDFLAGCRVLINLLPGTPDTAGIINQSLLSRLPEGAFVLNLARGMHVVEEDLLAALNSGKVAAAALDVFCQEPLPYTHPFWSHPHVSITPHNAAVTLPDEAMDYIVGAIAQLESGGQPAGRVDLQRGY